MLRSNLCDYSDAYIFVKEAINLLPAATNENDKTQKDVAFTNNAPLRSCISKINSTLIYNAEDLDIVLPMYNLLEYSQNYSMTSEIYGIIIQTKLMILMIMFQMVNHLNINEKIVRKTPKRPTNPGNKRYPNRPSQPNAPNLNV